MNRKIKKIICGILCICAIALSPAPAAFAEDSVDISAKSAIVLVGGHAVFVKNADAKMPMASTTKLMTAILALENCELGETVEIKPEYCNIEGSSMYLNPGESYTVEELVTGLLLVSGNDAAQALACHISGDTSRFAALMNEKAMKLGMTNTHFLNPHGLSENGHYSTARDMARLMLCCMKNKDFARITAQRSASVGDKVLLNHNRLLSSCPGCIGGKTGYTEAAGRCLVSCCEREGTMMVAVTLSAPDDWNDHMKLYDFAYGKCSARDITGELRFAVPVITGTERWAYLVPEEQKTLYLPAGLEITLSAELPWFSFAPVEAGKRDGKVSVLVDGECVEEYYLVYEASVALNY